MRCSSISNCRAGGPSKSIVFRRLSRLVDYTSLRKGCRLSRTAAILSSPSPRNGPPVSHVQQQSGDSSPPSRPQRSLSGESRASKGSDQETKSKEEVVQIEKDGRDCWVEGDSLRSGFPVVGCSCRNLYVYGCPSIVYRLANSEKIHQLQPRNKICRRHSTSCSFSESA